MQKQLNSFFITGVIILLLLFVSYSHAKPPKPGPNCLWVNSQITPEGHSTPGHWKHTQSSEKEKVWVPGHHAPDGKWVPGQWQSLSPSKKGSVWVPGHHSPSGRWIPGHWR